MESLYFVLGMLSILAVIFVAVVVWGLLKIQKQEDEIKLLKNLNEDSHRLIYSMNEEVNVR
jgi:flagellar biogenesis protein FliO